MWQATEIHCFKLHPELLFTNADKKKKKKEKKTIGFQKTFFMTLLLATHADIERLLHFG